MFEVDFHILNQKATPAIYADTLANRPAASFAGRLFVATDSPYGVFRDTGTAWVQIASNGGGGGSSTGVNGLNGTTNIGLGGNLTLNTTVTGNGANFLQFNSLDLFQTISSNINLQINNANLYSQLFSNGSYIYLGSFNSSNDTNAIINFNENDIYTSFDGGTNVGLFLNNQIGRFVLGDYSNQRKYNSIVVNDSTDTFYFTTSYNQSNTDQDLFYAVNSSAGQRFVKIGDFNAYTNQVYLNIDDANKTINTAFAGNAVGYNLDFDADIFTFGNTTSSYIRCNGGSSSIILSTTPEIQSGTITTTATPLIPSDYLTIVINGATRKIQLFNP